MYFDVYKISKESWSRGIFAPHPCPLHPHTHWKEFGSWSRIWFQPICLMRNRCCHFKRDTIANSCLCFYHSIHFRSNIFKKLLFSFSINVFVFPYFQKCVYFIRKTCITFFRHSKQRHFRLI